MSSSSGNKHTVNEAELNSGLRNLMYDAICTQIMGTFAGGAFLVAYALHLGASNLIIGVIAALAPLTQILQVPSIYLVEKIGRRKLLVVVNSLFSRLYWLLAAAVPWVLPESLQLGFFLFSLVMYYAHGTISGLSFNSWMKDLIPDTVRGSYTAKRMMQATIVGAGLSLLAGVGVDIYKQYQAEIGIYSIYYVLAGLSGLLGVLFLSRVPEPRMIRNPNLNLMELVSEPFKDENFRKLLVFFGTWNFAINLAAPFFTVYMLKRLGISMTFILGFAVLSQIANILCLRLWGYLSDRFSNRSVLIESGPLFILSIALWPFTTLPESWVMTIPLLVLIHVLAGMSTAGVTLCTGNIALELAPNGKATAYLAVVSLVSGCAAASAPLLGGLTANWLHQNELSLSISWISSGSVQWTIPAFDLIGLDFLFIASFLCGLYSLHRLSLVKEQGDVEKGIIIANFKAEVRKGVSNVSNVAGIRDLFYFPYARLREDQSSLNKEAENPKKEEKSAALDTRMKNIDD